MDIYWVPIVFLMGYPLDSYRIPIGSVGVAVAVAVAAAVAVAVISIGLLSN